MDDKKRQSVNHHHIKGDGGLTSVDTEEVKNELGEISGLAVCPPSNLLANIMADQQAKYQKVLDDLGLEARESLRVATGEFSPPISLSDMMADIVDRAKNEFFEQFQKKRESMRADCMLASSISLADAMADDWTRSHKEVADLLQKQHSLRVVDDALFKVFVDRFSDRVPSDESLPTEEPELAALLSRLNKNCDKIKNSNLKTDESEDVLSSSFRLGLDMGILAVVYESGFLSLISDDLVKTVATFRDIAESNSQRSRSMSPAKKAEALTAGLFALMKQEGEVMTAAALVRFLKRIDNEDGVNTGEPLCPTISLDRSSGEDRISYDYREDCHAGLKPTPKTISIAAYNKTYLPRLKELWKNPILP